MRPWRTSRSVWAVSWPLHRDAIFICSSRCRSCADIVFIVLLMFASGGISSGLGLLLLSGLAAAGLISRGRLTLFYAALASHRGAARADRPGAATTMDRRRNIVQAGLLSIGYFTTAWVAHTLAKYLVATEQLAAQREIDLASMAEVSQLVIQDMHDGVLVVDEHGVIRSTIPAPKRCSDHCDSRRADAAAATARAGSRGSKNGAAIRSPASTRWITRGAEQQGQRALRAGRPQPQCRRRGFSRGHDARAVAGAAAEARGARPAHRQHRA